MTNPSEAEFTQARLSMVELVQVYMQLSSAQIDRDQLDRRVLSAMAEVPRHNFVPPELRHVAYADSPIPIGCDKTVSQPFIVALMTDLLDIEPGAKLLEIGTGLGYHAAILTGLAESVFTVEIHQELAGEARAPRDPRLRQHLLQGRRRCAGLARTRALRPHPGGRGARIATGGADPAAPAGGAHGGARRLGGGPTASGYRQASGWPHHDPRSASSRVLAPDQQPLTTAAR
jgi:hypothetical protein